MYIIGNFFLGNLIVICTLILSRRMFRALESLGILYKNRYNGTCTCSAVHVNTFLILYIYLHLFLINSSVYIFPGNIISDGIYNFFHTFRNNMPCGFPSVGVGPLAPFQNPFLPVNINMNEFT